MFCNALVYAANCRDDFTQDSTDPLPHDEAGNLTYDGKYEYTYDAWNRLVTVTRAWDGGASGT